MIWGLPWPATIHGTNNNMTCVCFARCIQEVQLSTVQRMITGITEIAFWQLMERYKIPCVMHLPSLPLGLDPLFRVRSYPVRHQQDSLYPYVLSQVWGGMWCGTSLSRKARPCRFVMSGIPAIDQRLIMIVRCMYVSPFSRGRQDHCHSPFGERINFRPPTYEIHCDRSTAPNGQMRSLSIQQLRSVPKRRS